MPPLPEVPSRAARAARPAVPPVDTQPPLGGCRCRRCAERAAARAAPPAGAAPPTLPERPALAATLVLGDEQISANSPSVTSTPVAQPLANATPSARAPRSRWPAPSFRCDPLSCIISPAPPAQYGGSGGACKRHFGRDSGSLSCSFGTRDPPHPSATAAIAGPCAGRNKYGSDASGVGSFWA